ncbi:hypothetical protein HK096_000062, partial [Nowakowskiella sp. JEL0078]
MIGGAVNGSWKTTDEIWFLHISNTTKTLHHLNVSKNNNPVLLSPSFPPGKLILKSEDVDFITIQWDDDWNWIPDRSYCVWTRVKSSKKRYSTYSNHSNDWKQVYEGNLNSCVINIEKLFDEILEIIVGASGLGNLICTRFFSTGKNQLEIFEFVSDVSKSKRYIFPFSYQVSYFHRIKETSSLIQPSNEYVPYSPTDPSQQYNIDSTQLDVNHDVLQLVNDETLETNTTETEANRDVRITLVVKQPVFENSFNKQQIDEEEVIVESGSVNFTEFEELDPKKIISPPPETKEIIKRTREDDENENDFDTGDPISKVRRLSITSIEEREFSKLKDKKRKNSGNETGKSNPFEINQLSREFRKISNKSSPEIDTDNQPDDTILEMEEWMVFDAKRCRDDDVAKSIKGLPVNQGFPFNLIWGAKIDVYSESENDWYPAFALAYEKVTQPNGVFSWKLRIHFEGYLKQYDLSINLFSGDETHTAEELNKNRVRRRLKGTERFFATLNLKNETYILEANIVDQPVLKGLSNLKETELALKRIPVDWILEKDESIILIKKAWEAGINFFDTANVYSHGESEKVLGAAIKELNIPREQIVIATKLFRPISDDISKGKGWEQREVPSPAIINQGGLSRKHIFEAVEKSLSRLGVLYIDLYQIHRFDYETPVEETME